ncbi:MULTISPECIES: putative holin [Acinetobacter]|uniref:putative holin n=1 Tax=Acinetobacter TaxID=469 RepID=UPI001F4AF2CB|nr:putative holin [Acinetobacter higginsii]MCH7317938.1 phage holin family protein [Acinetobacter higginsii]
MPEPTTTTTSMSVIGLSAMSILPFINGNALLGAVLGAAFIASTEKDLSAFKRIMTLILATGIGYICTPFITEKTWITSDALAGLISSVFCLFILTKAVDWIKQANLSDIFKLFRGGKT